MYFGYIFKKIVTQPKKVIFCYCCILNGIIFKCKAAHFFLTQCFKKNPQYFNFHFTFDQILKKFFTPSIFTFNLHLR